MAGEATTLNTCVNDAVAGSSNPEPKTSNREKDENYRRVVVVLNEKWRVIECRERRQWILQKASPSEWRSKQFLTNKVSLIQRVRSLCGSVSDAEMAKLAALPDWFHQSQVVPS